MNTYSRHRFPTDIISYAVWVSANHYRNLMMSAFSEWLRAMA